MDRDAVEEAMKQKRFGVTEVKETVVYMENIMARLVIHSQLKKPNDKPERREE